VEAILCAAIGHSKLVVSERSMDSRKPLTGQASIHQAFRFLLFLTHQPTLSLVHPLNGEFLPCSNAIFPAQLSGQNKLALA
jgi:hypothetical protein